MLYQLSYTPNVASGTVARFAGGPFATDSG